MADMTLVAVITDTERLNSSVNGNPRYEFRVGYVLSGVAFFRHLVLSSDAGCGYEVGNPGYRVGSKVEFTLTRAGRVCGMKTLEVGA